MQSYQTKDEDIVFHAGPSLDLYAKAEELGNGSFGIVSLYKFKHGHDRAEGLPSQMAVKSIAHSAKSREKIIALDTNHKNVVKCYGVDITPELILLKMELANCSLKELKGKSKEDVFMFKDVYHLTSNILEGLSYLHSNGIAHRDMKPENILAFWDSNYYMVNDIVQMVELKIGDFGLSRYLPNSTATMTKVGTKMYMAPEILAEGDFRGEHYMLCDVYSTGIIILELLFGDEILKKEMLNSMDGRVHEILKKDYLITSRLSKLLTVMLHWENQLRLSSDKILNILEADLRPYLLEVDEGTFVASILSHQQELSELQSWEDLYVDPQIQKQLVQACNEGKYNVASVLIKRKGAWPDKPDNKGRVPLKEACKKGHIEIIRLLLENNATVNCSQGSYTGHKGGKALPLYIASLNGYAHIVKHLIDKGAKIEESCALFAAVENYKLPVVKILIENGALVSSQFGSLAHVLHHAIVNMKRKPDKDTGIIEFLLEAGADFEATDGDGNTPLHLICSCEYIINISDNSHAYEIKVAKLLLEKGATVNRKNRSGQTPLILACGLSHSIHENIIKLLAEFEANPNVPDDEGNSPLDVLLLRKGGKEAVEMLCQRGADLNARDPLGRSPIEIAIDKDDINSLEVLIQHGGADLNLKHSDGQTPIHRAYDRCSEDMVKILVGGGADVNVADRNGRTVLHTACQRNDDILAKYLVQAGADVNARDNEGKTPLGRTYRGADIQKLLIDSGAAFTEY